MVKDIYMRLCFITSIFAKSYKEADTPRLFRKNPNYDYFLFTNIDKKYFRTSWEIINMDVSGVTDLSGVTSNIITSRYPKFMGWKYIKTILKISYDVIFYCDGIYSPKMGGWDEIAKKILKHESGILQQVHKLNCYEDCDAILGYHKDTRARVDNMKQFLHNEKLPKDHKMMENTVFGYDPSNTKITNAFTDFWETYHKNQLTHRDQPLWGYFSWKHNIKPLLISPKPKALKGACFSRTGIMGYRGHRYV